MMVFLKNNTGGGDLQQQQQQPKSSNLKSTQPDQVLNNRLLPGGFTKKDVNMLKHQEVTSIADSAKESLQLKPNQIISKSVTGGDNCAGKAGVATLANPFTVKFEINIVVIGLFAVALGLRLYAIDQPHSVV